ncbi:unnamed protein product [Linum trigynum]|uniref:Uncharacterized protein n=1 Tax=Linum trigynum TaxID=586398 RepID=A0AAV2DBB3_9ROSI
MRLAALSLFSSVVEMVSLIQLDRRPVGLGVGMAFSSKDAVQDAFSEEVMRWNFEWRVKYSDSKELHVICKNAAEGCMWQLGIWVTCHLYTLIS